MGKFKEGQKVMISGGEGEPEVATVIEEQPAFKGMYLVEVTPESDDDDGLREIHEEQMEELHG